MNFLINSENGIKMIVLLQILIAEFNMWLECEERGFIPAEISVIEFDLESGVVRVLNVLVHHGDIPMGSAAQVLERSKRDHKIDPDLDKTNKLGLNKDYYDVMAVRNRNDVAYTYLTLHYNTYPHPPFHRDSSPLWRAARLPDPWRATSSTCATTACSP